MTQEEIDILISATDQASATIAEAGETIEGSMNQTTNAVNTMAEAVDASLSPLSEAEQEQNALAQSTQEAASALQDYGSAQQTVSDSQSQLSSQTEANTGSLKENAMAVNNLGTASMGLVMGIQGVIDAQTNLHMQQVTVNRDLDAYNTAQITAQKADIKVQSAKEALAKAVAKYGENSQQAQDAQNKLNAAEATAQEDDQKLATYKDNLSVAQERLNDYQNKANEQMLLSSMMIIPSVITATESLSTISGVLKGSTIATTVAEAAQSAGETALAAIHGALTTATEALSGAMDFLAANPIVLVIAGIAALAIGLYEAYEHCGPFRDAINAIGAVLGGAFSAAVSAVSNALGWLWNNVFKPFGEFLAAVFITYLKSLEAAWNALSSGVMWFWHNVLEPVANFLKTVFLDAINVVMAPINALIGAIKTVGNVAGSIGGAIGGALKTIGLASGGIVTEPTLAVIGEAGPEAVIPLNENFGDALQDISNPSASVTQASSSVTPTNAQGSGSNLNFNAPLMFVQGSADQATVSEAVRQMRQMLQNIVAQPTSSNGKASRIRTIQPSTAVPYSTY